MNDLAIQGGAPAFKQHYKEKWQRPKQLEVSVINKLILLDQLSEAGSGITKKFEEEFNSYIGSRYCLAFSHGTSALMAAYFAAGVGPGDEVITPAAGYLCSYSGALHLGARPIFCDLDPKTFLIDPKEVERKITPRTKAINIVHLNGMICDIDAFIKISDKYQIPIIDDASHAHGAVWNEKKIGNFKHLTCFSLQGCNPYGKPVSGGEGGVVCTNDRLMYQKMLAYCHLHRKNFLEELKGSPYEQLDKEGLGLKWRPHPLGMAIALISLKSLDYRNEKMSESYQKTAEILSQFGFAKLPETPTKAKMGGFYGGMYFQYDPSKLSDLPPEVFLRSLQAEGVPIKGPGFKHHEYRRTLFSEGFDLWGEDRGPIGTPWEGLEKFQTCHDSDFPHAEVFRETIFTLPCFIDVDEDYYTSLKKSFDKILSNHILLLK